MIELRNDQKYGIKLLHDEFRKGYKKIIFWAMTAYGKGVVMAHLVDLYLKNNKKVLTVVRRRQVVFQTHENYKKYYKINSSFIMGSSGGFNPNLKSQICSIDTIDERLDSGDYDFLKQFDIVIIDECHDTNAPNYRRLFSFLGNKFFIGFTATPFAVNGKPLDFWESCIKPVEAHELRDCGILSDVKEYIPQQINTEGIKKSNGDFNQIELFKRASENTIIGNIVKNFKEKGENKPAVLFGIHKQHSALMSYAFNAAKIPAIHIDESHNTKERNNAIHGARVGKYKIICNVNIFSTGIDMPFIENVICARPTMSEVLAVQQWGRGLRIFKICAKCNIESNVVGECRHCKSNEWKYEKKYCNIFDHAGNFLRHGRVYDIRHAELGTLKWANENKSYNGSRPVSIKTCKDCFAIVEARHDNCPYCANSIKSYAKIKTQKGELVLIDNKEIKKIKREVTFKDVQYRLDQLNGLESIRNWKPQRKFFILHKDFGDEIFQWKKELNLPFWLKGAINENDTGRIN